MATTCNVEEKGEKERERERERRRSRWRLAGWLAGWLDGWLAREKYTHTHIDTGGERGGCSYSGYTRERVENQV